MWQSPMCSMRSGSAHPQFEAGLLLRLMAPPRIKVAAVLYPLTRVKTFSKSSKAATATAPRSSAPASSTVRRA